MTSVDQKFSEELERLKKKKKEVDDNTSKRSEMMKKKWARIKKAENEQEPALGREEAQEAEEPQEETSAEEETTEDGQQWIEDELNKVYRQIEFLKRKNQELEHGQRNLEEWSKKKFAAIWSKRLAIAGQHLTGLEQRHNTTMQNFAYILDNHRKDVNEKLPTELIAYLYGIINEGLASMQQIQAQALNLRDDLDELQNTANEVLRG